MNVRRIIEFSMGPTNVLVKIVFANNIFPEIVF